jgi:hypothetical protein
VNIALVLKKVEVPPCFFGCVVNRTSAFAARRAGKASTTLKIHKNMQFAALFVKLNFFNEDGFFHAQRDFK